MPTRGECLQFFSFYHWGQNHDQTQKRPPHVTLNQIFAGMLPFMAIQVLAIALLYLFPAIGMWLPEVLYK